MPQLSEEIEAADAFLLLIGQKGLGSWQLLEYYEAFDRKVKQPNFPIVPVLLANASLRLPFLRQIHWLQLPDLNDTQALERLIAALLGGGTPPEPEPWRTVNPYRGLLALSDADAEFFFGREELTRGVIEKIRQGNRFVALVGNSGVGKSSLVKAGIIATLRRQRWPSEVASSWPIDLRDSRSWLFVTMTPGERPLYQLARAFVSQWTDPTDPHCDVLAQQWAESLSGAASLYGLIQATADGFEQRYGATSPRRFVLVVDQAEELYTRSNINVTQRFAEILSDGLQRKDLIILSSLRSDHYGHFQADSHLFKHAVRVDVPPLAENGLQKIVEKPTTALKARFEDVQMVPRIAAATARDPGALPLLSYLMEDMWRSMQCRGDGVLRWSDYPELVGVHGVITSRAEEFFEIRNDDGQRKALKRLFTLRLAHVPGDGEPVRRRARQDECSTEEWALAQELAGPEWRLLVTGEVAGLATVEVAHEVLLRHWERLNCWLHEEREFLQWKGQIEQFLYTWEQAGRDEEALLRGRVLARAADRLYEHEEDLDKSLSQYIETSLTAEKVKQEAQRQQEEVERQAELQRLKLQRQSARRQLTVALIALIGVTGLTITVGVLYNNLSSRTNEARNNLKVALSAADTLVISVASKLKELAGVTSYKITPIFNDAEKVIENIAKAVGESSDVQIRKVKLLNASANTFRTIGDPNTAWLRLKKARKILDELHASKNSDQEIALEMAVNYDIFGDLYWDDSKFSNAIKSYKIGLELAKKWSQQVGQEPSWVQKVAQFHRKIGSVQLLSGNYNDALREFDAAKSVLEASQEGDGDLFFELAMIDESLGNVLTRFGRIDEAIKFYDSSLEVLRRLVSEDPANTDFQQMMSISLQRHGDAQSLKGNLQGAAISLRSGLDTTERLIQQDPGNILFQLNLALARQRIINLRDSAQSFPYSELIKDHTEDFNSKYHDGIGPFRFGMTPQEINELLPIPFGKRIASDALPIASEYHTGEVRYFWRYFHQLPPFEFSQAELPCISGKSYVTFMFFQNHLFRISVRYINTPDCQNHNQALEWFTSLFHIPLATIRLEEGRVGQRFQMESRNISAFGMTTSYATLIEFLRK
jgi:tetratricopeptide (TPR) repeat protein